MSRDFSETNGWARKVFFIFFNNDKGKMQFRKSFRAISGQQSDGEERAIYGLGGQLTKSI